MYCITYTYTCNLHGVSIIYTDRFVRRVRITAKKIKRIVALGVCCSTFRIFRPDRSLVLDTRENGRLLFVAKDAHDATCEIPTARHGALNVIFTKMT